ncbi:PRLI-interacting factor putative [Euphorbia peplus]|nr:PRLI-interacting factor putative [Euphorbia peplus]
MNDQPQMMNPTQMMNQAQMMSQSPMMNQNPAAVVMVQSQPLNPKPQSQMITHNQQQQPPPLMMMNPRSYKPWPPMDPNMKFQSQQNPLKFNNNVNSNFAASKPRSNKNNWKGKNINNKDQRRMAMPLEVPNIINPMAGPGVSGAAYQPPSLNDLQTQNRMKARKYYHPKKKFNNRFAPYAPRNTTSFIIRAKKAGGIASLVSPCPVTPAVLPTPMFSPSREVLGDMAKEEWGVDGYGSMKGLIRLRSPGNGHEDDEEEEGNGSSESDVEEHVEVERRLDHDLSRFEMIYPNYGGVGVDYSYNNVLENRVDDQDSHIAQLEEENLTLKERLFLMERELGDLRRRMQFLERQHGHGHGHGQGNNAMPVEYVNEEVVENVSENDENESDGGSDVGATGDENIDGLMEFVGASLDDTKARNDVKVGHDIHMEEIIPDHEAVVKGGPGPVNDNAGSEFEAKDEVIVVEDGSRVEEEVRKEILAENVIVNNELLKPDDSENITVQHKVVQEEVAGEKDDMNEQS